MKRIFLYILLLCTASTMGQMPVQLRITAGVSAPTKVPPAGPVYDIDTQPYLTATGITDSTISSALDDLVIDLKANSLWAKGKLINPIAGGSAFTHKFNLKDPQDANASFRLAFSGGVTHSSNGMVGNGSTGYANTFLNPTVDYPTTGEMSIGIYSRTNVAGTTVDIGAYSGSTNYIQIFSQFGVQFYGQVNSPNILAFTGSTDSRGWFFACRTGPTANYIQWNTTETTFSGGGSSLGMVNNNIYVMAENGAGSPTLYSTRQIAFIWIGDALTTAEADILYNLIQTYQTALGRQMWIVLIIPLSAFKKRKKQSLKQAA
jgi:hypothetical protein